MGEIEILGTIKAIANETMANYRLNEPQIKAAVLTNLRQRRLLNKNSIIANEFKVGGSALRADLAILADEFIGIEIKSELDSLRRLPAQLISYVSYFDRVVIVAASKHLLRLDTTKLPPNVEICEIDSRGDLKTFIAPTCRLNSQKSPFALLTQAERRKFELNLSPLTRTDDSARERLEREYFQDAFRKKFAKSSNQFWQAIGRRTIRTADLVHLSRFHERRQKIKRISEAQERKWAEWHLSAEHHLPITEPSSN